MKNPALSVVVVFGLAGWLEFFPFTAVAIEPGDVKSHADQSFEQFNHQSDHRGLTSSNAKRNEAVDGRNDYPTDQYLIGKGQGDLAKGPVACRRLSELSARTDLAKQIRILVKEHMVDRVRERSGHDAEQDIEVTREEIVQEYLQGVKIVDRQVDETNKTCSATAVMPKSRIQPKPAPDFPEPMPTVIR